DVHLPARVTELHDELAVPLVHGFADALPQRDEIVAVHRRVVRRDAAFEQHRHEGRDDRADTALGKLALPVDPRLGERAVLVVPAPRVAGAEDAVLDRQVAEFERREDDIVVWDSAALAHDRSSAASAAIAPTHTARIRPATKAPAGHSAQVPAMN